jgi:tetratricopeptide (TPR) repeat protein
VSWAEKVLALPPLARPQLTYEERAALNKKVDSPIGLVEKTRFTDWYELVRVDLYDVMWFCRKCGVQSESYIRGTEIPPIACPVCGFGGYEPAYNQSGFTQPREIPPEHLNDKGELNYSNFYRDLVEDVSKVTRLSDEALELQERGKHEEAMQLNFQLERICRHYRILEPLVNAFGDQALLLDKNKSSEQAAELYGHAIRICREIEDKIYLQQYLGNFANIMADYGRLDTAMEMLKEQEKICRAIRYVDRLELSLSNQARVLIMQGKFAEAMDLLKEQENICRALDKVDGLEYSLALQAQILDKGGSPESLSITKDK